jgi:hypothetical protein
LLPNLLASANFSHTRGVAIQLDSGLLPFKFPKAVLKSIRFFDGKMDLATSDEDDDRKKVTVRVPGVSAENFCFAIQ